MKVFVSSTTKDLGVARKKVCEQLLQLDFQPVSMDWYTADGKPPKQLDDAKVKRCDAFVIIVGHLYGESPPDGDKSFTELEYDTASASGKSIYPFLASDHFLVSPSLREDDATYEKLCAFCERLEKDHTPRYFDNVDQLCTEVAAAIPRPVYEPVGLVVPRIPQPYLAHPYALQENFTGRRKERAMLTEWVRAQDGKPMLSLVGMGGLGKSALTWYWLREDLPQEKLGLSGIVWWSFYEREASFETFLSYALLYASGSKIDPYKIPSDYDKMQCLWYILHDKRFLLILDGAERLLRAYHALDVAYKGDDFAKQEKDQHLLCTDPRTGTFLQWLASPGVKTRTLLTTRLHPKELQGLAGCRKEELKRLDPDDAVEFMRRQGIKGPRTDIIHACKPYDFLPLCLRLLSGAIREDPVRPGYIKAAKGWHPPSDLVRREHHILQIAYDTMAKDTRNLLSRIAAMRGPVDYETVKVLSNYDKERKLKKVLGELVARGLLFRQEGKARYDLHPIVRQYAYDRLGDKVATHRALKDYFETVPRPEKIESLEDLLPAIELFHHTIASGGYVEAFHIYRNRLTDALYFQLGAYVVDISLKRAFFPNGEDKLPRLGIKSYQTYVLNDLALAYDKTGESRKAEGLKERHNTICVSESHKSNLSCGLRNLAITQMFLGKFSKAKENLQQKIKIDRKRKEDSDEAEAHTSLGLLLAYMGKYRNSHSELHKALAMQYRDWRRCMIWSGLALRAILMNSNTSALNALNSAMEDSELWIGREYLSARILWLSGAVKRRLGDLPGAATDLNEVLSRCRKIRLVEFEANILLEMAMLQWQKADGGNNELIEQAKSLINEAIEIADRCEYRLQQADIRNFIAQMAYVENDKVAARTYAETARERAYCDGPPYCYKKALEEAEQMLDKLRGQ